MLVRLMVDSSSEVTAKRFALGLGEIANPDPVSMPGLPRKGDFVYLPEVPGSGSLVVKSVIWTPFLERLDAIVILEA